MQGEIIIFLSLLIISSYFLYLAFQLPKLPFVAIGPEVWPATLLIGLIITCIIALASRFIKKNYFKPPKLERRGFFRIITTIIFIVLYAFIFEYLGFFMSTFLMFSTYLRVLNVRIITSVIVGLVFALLSMLIFPVMLLIPLPRGFGVFHDITTYLLSLFGR